MPSRRAFEGFTVEPPVTSVRFGDDLELDLKAYELRRVRAGWGRRGDCQSDRPDVRLVTPLRVTGEAKRRDKGGNDPGAPPRLSLAGCRIPLQHPVGLVPLGSFLAESIAHSHQVEVRLPGRRARRVGDRLTRDVPHVAGAERARQCR